MARTRKTSKSTELLAQPDPRAALDVGHFLAVAQRTLDLLTDDLLARADESPAITEALKARHQHEKSKQLTADAYPVWRRGIVVQIAAAWLLSCVFVRTLEDRGLLARNRLAGPGAIDAQRAFFQLAPHLGLREYLLTIFAELDHFPAVERLFDRDHNLAWRLAPSPEGAKALVELFRGPDPEQPHFRFGQPSTRFLGDLYQDISEDVRKRYALLQTPDFVESFILDRTLEPAIAEFGLRETTLIDPTCGSGHFLLGGFERLFAHWSTLEPNGSDAAHVERALASVFGVDINPYAVFIAQFRLTLAALGKLQVEKIAQAPELPINVVVADSLIESEFGQLPGVSDEAWGSFNFVDGERAKAILRQRYASVVGNPPYITEKDTARRESYRKSYESAAGKYALSAPYVERFFQLATKGGFVGQITSNSFMKREFGKALVQQVLPSLDLQSIINTSGAFIPGHGTPTVMLFGRNRTPEGKSVHAVLARRGEPTTPEDPAQGLVWSSIRDHWAEDGYEDEYVTVAKVAREMLAAHPWSLEGGGAADLKALLEERAQARLGDIADDIGFASFPGLDEVFLAPRGAPRRWGIDAALTRPVVIGEVIRDWACSTEEEALCSYSIADHTALPLEPSSKFGQYMWPYRTTASAVTSFGGKTRAEEGQDWWTWYRWQRERYAAKYRFAFAFVATHNHFVLDRGGKVFNRSAPIIKLPESATEDDHLALLAYLNSSTACFWMKQVAHDKGSGTDSGKWQDEPAKIAYEFTGTHLEKLPLPDTSRVAGKLIELGRDALDLASRMEAIPASLPGKIADGNESPPESPITSAQSEYTSLAEQLISIQEEIDWTIYTSVFPLGELDMSRRPRRVPLGLRPFEIHMARSGQSEGIDGQPLMPACSSDWAREEKELWAKLIHLIDTQPHIAKIETPQHKRRFVITPKSQGGRPLTFADRVRSAISSEFANRVESKLAETPTIVSRARIASLVESDIPLSRLVQATVSSAGFLGNSEAVDLSKMLESESVPFLSCMRFKPSGLEKHAEWQKTWVLQRREDAGEKLTEVISPPPGYQKNDYAAVQYWETRGKLDVPKERFIAYPGCESDQDNEPIYGWAGWNHAQRAEALLALYTARKTEEAWSTERLTPILAGIHELIPWLVQWHNEPDPDTGERLGDAYDAWLGEELRAHGLTRADLDAWRPVKKSAAKPKTASKSATKPAASDDPANLAKKKPGRKKQPAKAEDA